jgi:hypothetical protein
MQGLGEEEKLAEEKAIQLVKASPEELVAEYRKRYGIQVGTDLARELFQDYAASVESRLRLAGAVQRSAASVADMVFDKILSESSNGPVLFTAGGTGSGKTTAILSNIETNEVFQNATVIFDGNFNSFKSSKERVDKALQTGCSVAIIFVHRHPVEAYMNGVLPRAHLQGRTVQVDAHIRMHKDSIKAFLRADKHYKDNKSVSFVVINNTGREQESFVTSIDYLKSVRYDSTDLSATIQMELSNAYQQEKISQALYEASRGNAGS